MTYSRWSNSRWYTFWETTEDVEKDKQVFLIVEFDENISFTYKEISSNMKKCLIKVQNKTDCSLEELDELQKYMRRFKFNVEDEYRGK